MNFYTQRHQYTCGIDLHARTMYLCILDRDGQIVFDRNLSSEPAALLKAIEPFREDLVIAASCWKCLVLAKPNSLKQPDS